MGAIPGGLVGGQLIEYLGRKRTLSLANILFIISWILISVANNPYYIYIARAIVGFSIGIASLTSPVYLGETIQPEVRGTLGLFPTAFGNTGILLSYIIGSYLPWYQLAWVGSAFPIPFLLIMFLIPETPRWYVSKGRDEEAKKALQWLRGKNADINNELNESIKSNHESKKLSNNSSIGDIFSKINRKPLLISLGLMFFQQLSGINAVIFYTTSIFKMAGTSIPGEICTIIVGVVNFVSTFIATVLIDKVGRKVLLYISAISMIVTLTVLGTYFYLLQIEVDVQPYSWVPLASSVLYVLGFSLGFGPVPWLMLGEILPAKIRGSTASLATSFNWACTFIVTKTFVDILDILGPHGTFWLFGGICVIASIFVFVYVPETQGKTLEDIERRLVRRISSIANLKITPSSIS